MRRSLTVYLSPHERVQRESNPFSAWNSLHVQEDVDLYDAIAEIPTETLPLGLQMLTEEEGLETFTEDLHGDPIPFVRAEAFRRLAAEIRGDWNRGVFLFLAALPPKTRVVLWWE